MTRHPNIFTSLWAWIIPHRCHIFTHNLRLGMKRCDECGQEFWIRDGSSINKPKVFRR